MQNLFYSKYSRNEILSLIQQKLSTADILYKSKEELIEILKEEKKTIFFKNFYNRLNNKEKEKFKEIIDFIKYYANLKGKKQAIIDLQTALSLLNKNRRKSPLKTKNILIEDGIIGLKTLLCLKDCCKNYDSKTIKKYILKAIQSNLIFNTKNEKNIDTKKAIFEILTKLKGKINV